MTAPEALTFDALVTKIQSYCEHSSDSFVDNIPWFIAMAENRLASEARGLGFVKVVASTMNGATLQKPTRWRETKSFAITVSGSMSFLQARSYQYCRAFNPSSNTEVPRYYSDEDYEHWYFAPVPNSSYAVEIQYHERPEPLSSTNQTNWTTQYEPQLLLYACLLEAMPFLKSSARLPEFQGLYDRALLALGKEDEKRTRPDESAVRN